MPCSAPCHLLTCPSSGLSPFCVTRSPADSKSVNDALCSDSMMSHSLVFLHPGPWGWEVGSGEGVVAEMGSFSDLGSSLGALHSLEAGLLSPS